MVEPLRKLAWQFLIKLKVHIKFDPAIPLFVTYPRELKNYLTQIIYSNIYNSLVHNYTKLEKSLMFFNQEMDKQPVIDEHNRMLLSNTKQYTNDIIPGISNELC